MPRFRLPVLLVLVALIGAGLWTWRDYRDPKQAWGRAVHSRNPATRAETWTRLRQEGSIPGLDREESIQEVSALLEDADPEVRNGATSTLPSLGPELARTVPRLAERLMDTTLRVRVKAAAALGEVVRRGKPGREQAAEALAKGLDDPSPEVRSASVEALGVVVFKGGTSDDPLRSGKNDDPALALLVPRLKDDDLNVRIEAAFVLACNDRGDEAVPILSKLVRDQPDAKPLTYPAERSLLALMVLAVRSEEAAAFLVSELNRSRDGYPDRLRDCLLWDVKQSRESRERILKLAMAVLGSEDPSLRHNAALLMHRMGSGLAAVGPLVDALNDRSIEVRLMAIEALLDLGPVDPSIVPAIEAATEDPVEEVQFRAIGALQAFQLGAAGPPVIP
jgi:HEAT repeat protein